MIKFDVSLPFIRLYMVTTVQIEQILLLQEKIFLQILLQFLIYHIFDRLYWQQVHLTNMTTDRIGYIYQGEG